MKDVIEFILALSPLFIGLLAIVLEPTGSIERSEPDE